MYLALQRSLQDGDLIGILEENFVLYIFISENEQRKKFPVLSDTYLLGPVVGDGATSEVRKAWRREDVGKVAIKIIREESWPFHYSAPAALKNEVEIVRGLDHTGIVQVIDVKEKDNDVYIVMQYAEGGTLYDRFREDREKGTLDERVAVFRFWQISATVSFLHSHDICHRDLKLENILLDRMGNILIADFGLSRKVADILRSYVGTPGYIAPEIIESAQTGAHYDLKVDCWSLGVILYELLSGTHPFNPRQPRAVMNQHITKGVYEPMEGGQWEKISKEGKQLVDSLLQVDPDKRLSSSQILESDWFKLHEDVVVAAAAKKNFPEIGPA